MADNEKARELLAQQRQHDRHITDTMRDRAESELDRETGRLQEKAREILTTERQHEEHIKDAMLERTESEIHQ